GPAFKRHLNRYWPNPTLRGLLDCGHDDAVCLALLGLSLVGSMRDCSTIAPLLHDDDGFTAEMAEHALWSIWFRWEEADANEKLATAVKLISQGELDCAGQMLEELLGCHPGFAEAYHQLGLVQFLRGEYAEGITNCQAALMLNPWHFG